MWKCTKCEALNQEENCSSCGAHWTSGKQVEETPEYPEQYQQEPYPQQPEYDQPYAYQNREAFSAREEAQVRKQKNNGLIITIVICVTIIVAMLLALGAYIFMQREDREYRSEAELEKEIIRVIEKEVPVAAPSAEVTSVPTEIPELEPTPAPTPKPKKDTGAAKRQEFEERAAAIGSYAQAAGESAMTQVEINQASAEIFNRWDALLNDVYQYLKGTMPSGEFEALRKEELAWIKRKEAAMDEAAKEWEGGSGAPMAVNSVAADYTKTRCYELIDKIR